jgi:thioesterase domain-containing protein/acyl carrier protein
VELQLTKMWEQVLGIQQIGIKDNFFELGGHSLLAVRLITEIEQVWQQRLPLTTFLAAPTIKEFAKILGQQPGSTTWSPLTPIDLRGSKPPLFCIHPVGGNILEYYPIAHHLGVEHPIYGLQSRGLDGQQVPQRRIEDMAADYISEIQSVQANGPYFLIGYSFGGLVAFEMACQLDRQGQKIALLALIDHKSPTLPEIRPSFLTSVGIHFRNLQQLNIKEGLKYLRDRVVYRTVYSNREDQEKEFLLDYWDSPLPPEYLQVLEANFQAARDYIGTVYPGNVTLFRSSIQPVAKSLHPELGWGDLVSGEIDVHSVPGQHGNLLKEPCVQILTQKLKLCLEQSMEPI